MDVNSALWAIAGALGLAPGNLALIIFIVVFLANTISRKIPDTATGWKGTLRDTASWVGLHVRNVTGTPNIGVVPGIVLPTETSKMAGPAATTMGELADSVLEEPRTGVTDVFQKAAAAQQTKDVE